MNNEIVFKQKNKYTPEEDNYLLLNIGTMKYKDIGEHLGRSYTSIQNRLYRLNLRKLPMYNNVTKKIVSEKVCEFGYKTEAYYTEQQMLSCPYYNPLELTGEELLILNK